MYLHSWGSSGQRSGPPKTICDPNEVMHVIEDRIISPLICLHYFILFFLHLPEFFSLKNFWEFSFHTGRFWSKQDILPVSATRSTFRCCIFSCWSCPNPEGLESYNNREALWVWCTVFLSIDPVSPGQIWREANL